MKARWPVVAAGVALAVIRGAEEALRVYVERAVRRR